MSYALLVTPQALAQERPAELRPPAQPVPSQSVIIQPGAPPGTVIVKPGVIVVPTDRVSAQRIRSD